MYSRNRITAGLAAVTVAFALGACDREVPTSPAAGTTPAAEFQNSSRQFGLVNVSAGDVDVLNNVNLAVAANVVATVCGVTIPVAALATQVVVPGGFTCEGAAGPITIEQALPGENPASGPGGGNQSRQAGLINVSLGDVAILNNVNAAIAANVLISACGLTVPVAILAVQAVGPGANFTCTATADPTRIVQLQG